MALHCVNIYPGLRVDVQVEKKERGRGRWRRIGLRDLLDSSGAAGLSSESNRRAEMRSVSTR